MFSSVATITRYANVFMTTQTAGPSTDMHYCMEMDTKMPCIRRHKTCSTEKLAMCAGTATGSLIRTCCLSALSCQLRMGKLFLHMATCVRDLLRLPIQCKVQGNDDQSQGACLMHISKLGRADGQVL